MFLLWILNILDLLVAVVLVGAHIGVLEIFIIPTVIYLVFKGLMLIKDPFSIIDLFIAIYLLVLALGIKTFLTWIFVIYLLYKTVISLRVVS